jgi:hypothetical protein
MCAYGYTHRKDRPVRRYAKTLTCYEIGQQAEPQLERLLIEASVIPSLLYPTGRYQQSLNTLRNWSASRLQSLIGKPTDRSLCHAFVALSDRWISTPPLGLFTNANDNHIPMCAYGYTHRKGKPVRRHAEPRHATKLVSKPNLNWNAY